MDSTLPPPPSLPPPPPPSPPPPPPPQAVAVVDDEPVPVDPPERRPLDRRGVVAAVACGVVFDLAVRRSLTSSATAALLTITAFALLASGRLETPHSRRLMAAVPLFTVWVAVRTSPWLIPLDLIAASLLVLASLATSDARSLRSIGPADVVREFGLTVAAVVGNVGFVRRALRASRRGAARAHGRPVLVGLALMIPIVAVLGALLASGDALTAGTLRSADIGTWSGHIGLAGLGAWLVLALVLRASSPDPDAPAWGDPKLGPVEATVVLAGIVVLYGAFAALQVAGALGAAPELIEDPAATANWAREGFFQLLWAAGFTLGVVVVLDRLVDRTDAGPIRRYRRLVVATCALTCVVVAVSVVRIVRYSDAFGLTMLRLYAGLFAVWVAAVFGLVASRARHAIPPSWLASRAAAAGLGLLLILNVVNPEALVVRADTTSAARFDIDYLVSLSTDAIPTLIDRLDVLDQRQRGDLTTALCALEPPAPDGWLSWNRSRHEAREQLVALCGPGG